MKTEKERKRKRVRYSTDDQEIIVNVTRNSVQQEI